MDSFLIGDLLLEVNITGVKLAPGIYMEKFRYCCDFWEGKRITFNGRIESLEPYLKNKITDDNGIYEIYDSIEEPIYVYHWGRLVHGFIIQPEKFTASFAPQMINQVLPNADWFFGISGLHHQLLQYNAPILHASYVNYKGQGIIFTGPSQTGKSTQAALWEKFGNARIINGDRVLLRQRQDIWNAFGFPCCGSSKICVNCTLPLAVIVCLEQGDKNQVEQMTYGQKVRVLVSGMEFYRWNEKELEIVFQLAKQLSKDIPVIRFICCPDSNAVSILKNYLIQEGILNDF